MKALRVWGMTLHRRVPELTPEGQRDATPGSQVRGFVAARSRAEAGRLFGLSKHETNGGWKPVESGNHREVSVALAQPGHVFYRVLLGMDGRCVPAPGPLPKPVVHEADFFKVRAGRSPIGRGAQQWNHGWRCLCGAVSEGNMDRAESRRDFTAHKREASYRASIDADEAASRGTPTVLYFSATWCQPCVAFGPRVDELAKAAGVDVIKIDVDDPPIEFAQEAKSIRSVPLLRWVGDRPGAQSLSGAVKRETLAEWFKIGVEDSKR